ncbi:MAG: phosphate ABC transporter permease PstA [Maricaulaceae bacterium]
MTDTTANEASTAGRVRAAANARLKRRYRAEAWFQFFGRAAIVVAVAALLSLLGSVGWSSRSAFTVHEITLDVTLEADLVDPLGDQSERSIRRGNFNGVFQAALREQFPSVDDRARLRDLFGLIAPINAAGLLDLTLENPDRIGETIRYTAPLSDDGDLFLKGALTPRRETPGRGIASPSGRTGSVEISSTSNQDFGPIVTDVKSELRDRADALARQAERADLRAQAALAQRDRAEAAGLSEAAETAALAAQDAQSEADRFSAQAQALRQTANRPGDFITLTPATRSVLVAVGGGVVKLTEISPTRALGEVVTPLDQDTPAQPGAWSVIDLATPEADRRISDAQVVWIEALADRGIIRSVFNHYLFTRADSREPELAGVLGAFVGTLLTMLVTMALAVPIGVCTAIYLEEYARSGGLVDLVEVNINNLAAVPSIVFGLLGLAIFLNTLDLPRSAPVVGGMVLALMTLPTVIISSRAALKAVPPSIREAALGMGASKTQTVFHHVLPLAAPGVLTGSIIGLAQAMGVTAPLLMIGMVAFIADVPAGFTQPATVMPVQVYLWSDLSERAFEARTAAAIVVLLVMMVILNALAVYLRRRFERRW